jgi:hypothetical protein
MLLSFAPFLLSFCLRSFCFLHHFIQESLRLALGRRSAAIGLSCFWGIFAFNLALSAFAVVMLPGMVFFPLSTGFLVFRAVLWGLLFYPLPASLFLAVLPTLILEGEAYTVAVVAGTIVGLSWVKPGWLFKGKELSRLETLKIALKEVIHLYIVVVLLLLAAAIAETIAILSV